MTSLRYTFRSGGPAGIGMTKDFRGSRPRGSNPADLQWRIEWRMAIYMSLDGIRPSVHVINLLLRVFLRAGDNQAKDIV